MKKVRNWLFDYPNLEVYQYEEGFKFSLDSILLAEFANIKKKDQEILDICTGNAVIPIILNYKHKKKIVGIELQKEIADLAVLSVCENNLEKDIRIINDDALNLKKYYKSSSVDVILCNPPYFKVGDNARVNNERIKKIARHEIKISLEEILKMTNYLLKAKGRLFLVHVPDRLDEIIIKCYKNNLFVKKIQFIYSNFEKKPIIVLLEIHKEGNLGTKVLKPINITGLKTYQGLFEGD